MLTNDNIRARMGGVNMAWLEIHQSIKDHRKVLAAADILDISPVHLMGHIISFWLWALDNTPDGSLGAVSLKTIARAAQWDGNAEEFVVALTESGLVDRTDSGLFIHDWADYAGKLIDRRVADKERKRKTRAEAKQTAIPKDVRKMSNGQNEDVQKMSFVTVHNSTVQNTTEDNTIPKSAKRASGGGVVSGKKNSDKEPPKGFDRFWSVYPRKVGKKDAVKVWNQIKPDDNLIDQIVQGVERWKRSEQWTKDEGRFIPYPATFLRGERWNEYDRTEVTPSSKPTAAKNYDDGEDFFSAPG